MVLKGIKNMMSPKALSYFYQIKGSNGKIFTVTFYKKDRTLRTLNCRTGVKKYVKGVKNPAQTYVEDYKNSVVTVWSIDTYNENIKSGMKKEEAGFNAWRRINLEEVVSITLK